MPYFNITTAMPHNNEIIIYNIDQSYSLEVKVEKETVWLNRHQIAQLFDRDIKTIGKHINNALKEELAGFPVVAKFATTATDGKTYQVEYYNLDVVISVGYRVKSNRGILFRIWANKILKEHLLKGYSINEQYSSLERRINSKLAEHDYQIRQLSDKVDFFVRTSLPPKEGIFMDGQIFDAYTLMCDLIRSAKRRIVLIDNYIDDSVLNQLNKRNPEVSATIFTSSISRTLRQDLERLNAQYPPITIKIYKKAHDRFLIIDNDVYHVGASLKDLGKKLFAFAKMEAMEADMLIQHLSD